ncbi:DNA-processing protein DprA [Catenisphaera adipataccumulans]|uniref:DNA processing protein n=1 Tax=Catenisphaera adipataccumulans TaxID=700500 RepID=A0A7W8FYE6_9FIRM|nr:DNA-processing protein DprA [Catenisphaera adipataccumulans]MBB5183922.1 DNA processing protein [Catenisphaera adipataccumulans]
MNALRSAILWYAVQYDGSWQQIGKAIRDEEPYEPIVYPYEYVTIVDPAYPDCLRRLRYPPWILFYQGHWELAGTPCIGIVGSRQCSMEGLKQTVQVVNRVKHRYTIVSGLAKGIDAASHQAALDTSTIGILGCGIDRIYPKENKILYETMRTHHLIISEYPMGSPPKAFHFPWRNRLIAAFSNALIVIQATYKSGTMLTVKECIDLSVPVYCLPTSFNDSAYPGCNLLISQGANILCGMEDLDEI